MNIAVLGAGAMGGAAAVLLARHKDVELLVLDVNERRAREVAEQAGAEGRGFDATSGELETLLGPVQAVAACLPYKLNLPVMEAALAAGCHYADLGGLFHTTLRQWELHDRWVKAGVSAVLGIGSAPGLTNVLARWGADQLDEVVSIDMVDGAVDLSADGGAFGVPYSVETVLDEFTMAAVVFEDGELKEVPAGSGVVDWEFPQPVGVQPSMYTLHSEPATLPRTVPGVRDVRWRLALPRAVHEGFAFLARIGMASDQPVQTPSGAAVPRETLAAVLSAMPSEDGDPHDVEFLDVRVSGTRDGAAAACRCLARLDPSPEGLSAGAFGTAIPITVAVRWLAEGRVPPGVHPPESAFDAAALIAELEREGVTFSLELTP
ncbi:MAG TPA: saccharopine dehydrogenase C-terminal domain-containing protein [Actinomycetota bacterium]|jgi:saccharopine dehydrogenase (NAD+, L-lysine-forming)|nr:saccharopine dehydrogenase C-terminal domain-containing protein [Actinomycetota bacterium]